MSEAARERIREWLRQLIEAVGEDETRSIWREVVARHAAAGGATVGEYRRTLREVVTKRAGLQ